MITANQLPDTNISRVYSTIVGGVIATSVIVMGNGAVVIGHNYDCLGMFWKKDGRISPSAFADPRGLSVERGLCRKSEEIVEKMKKTFSGCIVSFSVGNCRDVDAVVKYLPSKDNDYHSEVHGSDTVVLLSKSQRFHLAEVANKEYMEE